VRPQEVGDGGSGTDSTNDTTQHTDGPVRGDSSNLDSPNQGDTKGSDVVEETQPEAGMPEAAPDGTGSTTINCPTMPCTGGLGCCAQLTGDAGFRCEAKCTNAIDCLKNSDCADAAPICCATAVIDDPTGTPPSCIEEGAKSVTTVCAASAACASNIDQNLTTACDATDTVRGCTTSADCTDKTNYPDCCQITVAGATLSGCVSDLIKELGGLTCD
jgi:hypothetical protein